LDSEVYVGRWYDGKTQATKDAKTGKRRYKPQPREEWMMIPVPAIISDELFEAVQQRREANKRQLGHQRKHEYTLGGMVRCGECGNGMSGMTRTHKSGSYAYYKCNSRHVPSQYELRCSSPLFKTGPVEAAAWGWIKSLLLEPAVLRKAIEQEFSI
jgi:site-specific DNA recombinase